MTRASERKKTALSFPLPMNVSSLGGSMTSTCSGLEDEDMVTTAADGRWRRRWRTRKQPPPRKKKKKKKGRSDFPLSRSPLRPFHN